MSQKTQAGAAGQAAALPADKALCADVPELRMAVHDMDAIAHEALAEIAALARLALLALENPATALDTELTARSLSVIWAKAEDADNALNAQAEQVGCNSNDEPQERRAQARRFATVAE